jgi:hypothetical protein
VTPDEFVRSIQHAKKFDNVFNPYVDTCSEGCDVADAPQRRSRALLALLDSAAKTEIDSFWIGRDLGHGGGRRTGVALTDDVHIPAHELRWNISVERATIGPLVSELTACAVWGMLAQIRANIFLWNVFPFHSHERDRPFSNRDHSAKIERPAGLEIMEQLIRMLKPRRIIALGDDAERGVKKLKKDFQKVRHPSFGGQKVFADQIGHLYGLKDGNR